MRSVGHEPLLCHKQVLDLGHHALQRLPQPPDFVVPRRQLRAPVPVAAANRSGCGDDPSERAQADPGEPGRKDQHAEQSRGKPDEVDGE